MKRKKWTESKQPCKDRELVSSTYSVQAKEHQGFLANYLKLGGDKKKYFLCKFYSEGGPADTLISHF